jgi:anti-anti-sigma regulatory factor
MSTFYQAEREIVASPEEKGYEAMILNHTCLVLIPSCFTVVRAVSFKQDFQKVCQENSDLTEAAFDFSQTTFMDSSGLGALVGCWKLPSSTAFG